MSKRSFKRSMEQKRVFLSVAKTDKKTGQPLSYTIWRKGIQ